MENQQYVIYEFPVSAVTTSDVGALKNGESAHPILMQLPESIQSVDASQLLNVVFYENTAIHPEMVPNVDPTIESRQLQSDVRCRNMVDVQGTKLPELVETSDVERTETSQMQTAKRNDDVGHVRGPISPESRELRFVNEIKTKQATCIFCNQLLPKTYAEIQKHIDEFHKPVTTKAQKEEQMNNRCDFNASFS